MSLDNLPPNLTHLEFLPENINGNFALPNTLTTFMAFNLINPNITINHLPPFLKYLGLRRENAEQLLPSLPPTITHFAIKNRFTAGIVLDTINRTKIEHLHVAHVCLPEVTNNSI